MNDPHTSSATNFGAFGTLKRKLAVPMYPLEGMAQNISIGFMMFSAVLIAFLGVPICVDVVARTFLGMSVDGIMEIEILSLVLIVFFAMGYVTFADQQIRIDIFFNMFNKNTQARLNVFATVLCMVIAALIAWEACRTALGWSEKTPVLMLPEWIFVFATGVGMALVSIGYVYHFLRALRERWQSKDRIGILISLGIFALLCAVPFIYKGMGIKVSGLAVGGIGFFILFTMLMLRVPIGLAMAMIGLLGLLVLKRNPMAAFSVLGDMPFRQTSDFVYVAVPMFMLMGELTFHSGLSEDLFNCANKWLGRLPGGLAVATVGGCAGFGAVCGESLPTVITMSAVALPQMRAKNYDSGLAAGALAAGGTLGILIPPSMGFIFYSIMTEQSIGRLFMAGILPGILLTLLFMAVIVWEVKRNPALAPKSEIFTLKEKMASLTLLIPMVVIFTIVVGGILVGAFTPGEGGAVGAMGAFLYALGRRRLTMENFRSSVYSTALLTGKVFLIFVGVFTFGAFLATSRLPHLLAQTITELSINRYAVLFIVIAVYILLGCVMNIMPMMLLTLPSIYPTIEALGFDGIWFGVITVIVMEMGLITPPIGLNVFTLSSLAPDIPMVVVFRGVLPFFLAMCVCVLCVILFPPLATWLPSLM